MNTWVKYFAFLGLCYCVADAQTPPPVGAPNEVWLDVSYEGKVPGKIETGVDFSLDFYFANSELLVASVNGFKIWSPDGVTWSYRSDPSWYGTSDPARGDPIKAISLHNRHIGAYGIYSPILAPNPLLGGSAGAVNDSVMTGGFAFLAPGLPAGPLEKLVQLNMTMGPNEGTLCVDFLDFFAPNLFWGFDGASGSYYYPAFAGTFCWTVENPPPTCCQIAGDSDDNGTFNISDAVHDVNRVFKGGPASPCCDAADGDDNGTFNISDAVYKINHVFKGGPAPVCGSAGNGPCP
jgi:hypothetical protein